MYANPIAEKYATRDRDVPLRARAVLGRSAAGRRMRSAARSALCTSVAISAM
jgi:hypothetical protein